MNAGFNARTFDALVRKLRDKHGAVAPPASADLLEQFVHAFLLWEAEQGDAERALKRVASAVVDFNELRVCLLEEIVQMFGVRYPRAQERAARLKSGLHDVFLREHAVTFDHLKEKNKRVARQYLESLEGVPPYVSGRMMVVGFGGHAAPLDERMLAKLAAAAVFDDGLPLDRAAGLLERHIKAEDALEVHLLLVAGCEEGGGVTAQRGAKSGKGAKSRASRPPAKKPARKE